MEQGGDLHPFAWTPDIMHDCGDACSAEYCIAVIVLWATMAREIQGGRGDLGNDQFSWIPPEGCLLRAGAGLTMRERSGLVFFETLEPFPTRWDTAFRLS
jgi:hypothetical protein